jgi:signal transduction histidine kinase
MKSLRLKILVRIILVITIVETVLLIFSIQYQKRQLYLEQQILIEQFDYPMSLDAPRLSRNYVQDQVALYTVRILWLALLIILVSVLMVYVSFDRIVISPIRRLNLANEALAAGDEETAMIKVSEMPNDDLGDIMRSRRKMLEKLEITQKKLKMLNCQLEDKVADRTQELENTHERLKESQAHLIQVAKLESVGQLAAGVAHEVKNPLAILQQGTAFLSDLFSDNDCPESLVLNKMDRAITRADTVIKGLLDLAVPRTLEISTQSFVPILEDTLLLVSNELIRCHISVDRQLDSGLPPLALDQQKIEQVFINLILNACHAIVEHGKITVRAYSGSIAELRLCMPREALASFAPEECVVVAEILDSGPGIPEDKLARIFSPFFTTKPVGQGTGLGLAVTKSIIELHSGAIGIGNLPGQGVKVTIVFRTSQEREVTDDKEKDPDR